MSLKQRIPALVVAAALCAGPAYAQGRGRGHDKHRDDYPTGTSGRVVTREVVIDRDGHARAVREYAHDGTLPPGLARREALPPGLRAQLHERGTLPPGLQRRLVPVPYSLARRMPRIPSYDRRYFAGDDLVIVDTRTHYVVAIIPDVWR